MRRLYLTIYILLAFAGVMQAEELTVENVTVGAGESSSLNIGLTNAGSRWTAYQFLLALPEGVELEADSTGTFVGVLSDRQDESFSLTIRSQAKGLYSIVCYSASSHFIKGKEGILLKIPIQIDQSLIGNHLYGLVSEIILSEDYGQVEKLGDVQFDIDVLPPFYEVTINVGQNGFVRINNENVSDRNLVYSIHWDTVIEALIVPNEGYHIESLIKDGVSVNDSLVNDEGTIRLIINNGIVLFVSFAPNRTHETEESVLSYDEEKGGYQFTGTKDTETTEATVPKEVNGIPVVAVPEGTFAGNAQMQVLTWDCQASVAAECFNMPEEHGNLLVFTADTAKVTYTGNVVKGNVANHVKLYDGRPMTNPQPFIAQSISITKEFSKETIIGCTSGWETIVVPFDVDSITMEDGSLIAPFGSDAATTRYFWLAKMDVNVGFTKDSLIRANIPYIISMPNSERYEEEYRISGKVTFHGTNVEVQPTANAVSQSGPRFGIVPTYQEVAAADSVYVLNDEPYEADGITWPAGSIFVRSSRAARPFEAYTYANASSTGHVKGYIPLDKMATGIEGIKQWSTTNGSGAVYDLSGRKFVNGKPTLRKGIYIKDGHKVLVK